MGARLNWIFHFGLPPRYAKDVKVIQLDIAPEEIGHNKPTEVALVGDGGFGQNPSLLATAVEDNVATIWVVMNNNAYGVIAGLEKAHFGTTFGTVFPKGLPDYAAIARAYGAEGVSVKSAEEFKSVIEQAVKSNKPFVIDVQMQNVPTPTAGHWNIMDIYSPNKHVHHVSTD